MLNSFATQRALVEAEGIYVGGWSLKRAIWPKKMNGVHGT
jgi:hypothetical protein